MSDDAFGQWIGRSEIVTERLCPGPRDKLAALLDHDGGHWADGALPPLGQWLYANDAARQSHLGADGHPSRGGFMPPISFPRRMWASSALQFHTPLRLEGLLRRESTIAAIEAKTGRAGAMVFVTVRHALSVDGLPAVTEDQTIVYRDDAQASPARGAEEGPLPQPPPRAVVRTLTLDPVMLFRYSALTFNSHRIHYDADYAVDVEGYPNLVVQGPFLATLLIDHFLRNAPGSTVRGYRFRAQKPVFAGEPIRLVMLPDEDGAELSVVKADGAVAMQARVALRAGAAGLIRGGERA